MKTLELSFNTLANSEVVEVFLNNERSYVLTLIDGMLELDYTVQGQLVSSTSSTSLDANKMYSVSFGVNNNELVLQVDSDKFSSVLLEFKEVELYSGETFISLGGFDGKLKALRVYDASSSDLLSFSDSKKSVTIPSGEQILVDQIGLTDEGKSLGMALIGGHQNIDLMNETSRLESVSLVSSDLYQDVYSDFLNISRSSIGSDSSVRTLFSSLRNGNYNLSNHSLENAFDSSVPSEDGRRLVGLLTTYKYYTKGQNNGSRVDTLVKSVVDANNREFNNSMADLLGRAMSKARSGDTRLFDNFNLVLTVLAEMAEADSDLVTTIFKSIGDSEELHAWLEFISLPIKGWPGIQPPALNVNDTCDSVSPISYEGVDEPFIICRNDGLRLGALISVMVQELGLSLTENPRLLSGVITQYRDIALIGGPGIQRLLLDYDLVSSVSSADSNSLAVLGIPDAHADGGATVALVLGTAALIAAKRMIRIASKLTRSKVGNLKAILANKTSFRVDARSALAILLYVESRLDKKLCDELSASGCKTFTQAAGNRALGNIEARVTELLGKIYYGVIDPEYFTVKLKPGEISESVENETRCNVRGTTNGAMFELILLAYFHALHEFDEQPPVIGLDVPTNVFLTYKKSDGEWGILRSLQRRPDLVLLAENIDGEQFEKWIEAKSVQAYPSNYKGKSNGARLAKLPKESLTNWSPWSVLPRSSCKYRAKFI
jgi:hypothetical protein